MRTYFDVLCLFVKNFGVRHKEGGQKENFMQVLLDRIKKIEAEQKRRADSKLSRYNRDKVHEKQMAFHRCMKRNRWVFGGNRSGKTECGAVETVWL
ncbi:MAG TPA: hypothetical protein DHU79_01190, partial [Clostridiales bacterium]|nr:hypothetical protein [Clostridiales bacterium]